ncbi:hypothetical protein EUX98_g9411 [Antrodiella citrinella]|uniref:HAM1-like N-terminal domain-containing protein n=1 Tax=Antrodiella citrinella TaxID=2447956 RepID=A0A4S4LTK8_9APHY|nr:hypothetical protein EUX98_g9411 [Antrodiella citrinella]
MISKSQGSALYAVLWDIANIPASASDSLDADVRVFFVSLGRWVDTALNDPAYAISVSGRREIEGLYDQARTFMSQSSRSDALAWVRDLHVLIREIEAFTAAIENDKTTRKFFTALDSLTDALSAFSPRTAARHTLRHLQTDTARWLVPHLLRAARAVPVPRVEYASQRVHATVDALFLADGVDVDLVPDRVRVTTTKTVSVDLRDHSEVGVRGATRSVSLHVDGVRFAVRDVGYSVRYTPPLWFGCGMLGYINEGYISVEVGSEGEGGVSIDVDVDMDVHPSFSGSSLEDEDEEQQQPEPKPKPLFTISSVHLTIPHLRLTTHDTRHPIMNALLGKLARPLVVWYLTRQVYALGDALGRVLVEAYLRAALTVYQTSAPPDELMKEDQDTEGETHVTPRGVVHTTAHPPTALAVGFGAQVLPENTDPGSHVTQPGMGDVLEDVVDAARRGLEGQADVGCTCCEGGQEGWRSGAFDW